MQELNNSQFLSLLRKQSVEIHARDGRLQINAPAGALNPEIRAELVRRKDGLLCELNEGPQGDVPLAHMERPARIPQTHAQQRLWLIDKFEPGNAAYNIPEAFILDGPIHAEALQKAVDGLVIRHETLRTYFYQDDGELFQAVCPAAAARVGFTDLSRLAERDQALHDLMRQQARQPFDLRQAPLVRFHLFRLAEQQHVIFFNIQHIIADRWSLNILLKELSALYQAAIKGETASLPDIPVQYADYAIWESKHLKSEAIKGQIQYWKRKLAGIPPYLELPCSRPYPRRRTAWGATVPVEIPASLRDALGRIGREENASLFITLLAALAVLLHRSSGQEDFCIGSPITHRKRVGTEPIIGLFVNMLVYRCEFGAPPSFREFLSSMRDTALEAYENSDVPFQEIVSALNPDRKSRRSPFFQVMLGFDAATPRASDGLLQIDTDPGTARFDLTLQLSDRPEGISGRFEYCTDLFDESAVAQLSELFLVLLQEIASHPDKVISRLGNPYCEVRK